MWSIAALPLGIYVIVQDLNIPLIVQPQLFALFTLFSWMQCMYYGRGRSRRWCVGVLGGMIVVYAALEASMVFALRVRTRSMLLLCSCSLTGVRFLIAVV
jgi:hypothetical protein